MCKNINTKSMFKTQQYTILCLSFVAVLIKISSLPIRIIFVEVIIFLGLIFDRSVFCFSFVVT